MSSLLKLTKEFMKKLVCHCGEVEAIINIKKINKLLRCNCSICISKGAIMSMVKNEEFRVIKGEEKLKLYQFHTKVAKHFFCSVCGIYTHHNPRSNPAMTGFNIGCTQDINNINLKDIQLIDGQNHPLDKK